MMNDIELIQVSDDVHEEICELMDAKGFKLYSNAIAYLLKKYKETEE